MTRYTARVKAALHILWRNIDHKVQYRDGEYFCTCGKTWRFQTDPPTTGSEK